MSSDGPIITHLYTADPSAHVFKGKIYVYPSHDVDAGIEDNDNGDQYAMNDYHVFSMDSTTGPVTDHGVVLAAKDIPWVSKQLWAPDAAEKNGKYYLYFPARDKDGIFRIGVAESSDPAGPFKPDADYIKGSYTIDPASFVDDNGSAYLYVGGLWGGQLQCWQDKNKFDDKWSGPQELSGKDVAAQGPLVAKLSDDMHQITEELKEVKILAPESGKPILADDHDRRFFEAAWVHKYNGKYYLSYSTGDTHYIVYAISDNPYGPFTYAGRILEPVLGWTTHHSIVEHESRWYIFHHDSSLSGGKNHLRSVKVKEIFYDGQGKIKPAQ